jgi:hypothetical protein
LAVCNKTLFIGKRSGVIDLLYNERKNTTTFISTGTGTIAYIIGANAEKSRIGLPDQDIDETAAIGPYEIVLLL